jgi:hypothetical protein
MSKPFIIKPHLEKKNKSFRQLDLPRLEDLFHRLLGSLYFLFNFDVVVFSRLVNLKMQNEVLKIVVNSNRDFKNACSHIRIHINKIISCYKLYLTYCQQVEDYLELSVLLDKPDSILNLRVKHNPLTNPVPRELELKTLEYFKLQMNNFIDKNSPIIDLFGLSRELQQFLDKGTRNFPIHEDIQEKNKLDKISQSFQVLSSKEQKIIRKLLKLIDEKTKDALSIHAILKRELKSFESLTKYLSLKIYTTHIHREDYRTVFN